MTWLDIFIYVVFIFMFSWVEWRLFEHFYVLLKKSTIKKNKNLINMFLFPFAPGCYSCNTSLKIIIVGPWTKQTTWTHHHQQQQQQCVYPQVISSTPLGQNNQYFTAPPHELCEILPIWTRTLPVSEQRLSAQVQRNALADIWDSRIHSNKHIRLVPPWCHQRPAQRHFINEGL